MSNGTDMYSGMGVQALRNAIQAHTGEEPPKMLAAPKLSDLGGRVDLTEQALLLDDLESISTRPQGTQSTVPRSMEAYDQGWALACLMLVWRLVWQEVMWFIFLENV